MTVPRDGMSNRTHKSLARVVKRQCRDFKHLHRPLSPVVRFYSCDQEKGSCWRISHTQTIQIVHLRSQTVLSSMYMSKAAASFSPNIVIVFNAARESPSCCVVFFSSPTYTQTSTKHRSQNKRAHKHYHLNSPTRIVYKCSKSRQITPRGIQ